MMKRSSTHGARRQATAIAQQQRAPEDEAEVVEAPAVEHHHVDDEDQDADEGQQERGISRQPERVAHEGRQEPPEHRRLHVPPQRRLALEQEAVGAVPLEGAGEVGPHEPQARPEHEERQGEAAEGAGHDAGGRPHGAGVGRRHGLS